MKPAPPVTRMRMLPPSLFVCPGKSKSGFHGSQQRLGCIFCGKSYVGGHVRPGNRERRIVSAQAPVVGCAIGCSHFVMNDCVGFEREEAMREAFRDPELVSLLRRKRHAGP